MGRAILAGGGALPGLLLEAGPALAVTFAGVAADLPGGSATIPARFEQLGTLMAALRAAGVRELCFAGAMARPALDPSALDAETAALMPRLAAAMARGDDALLRDVIAIFEEAGFAVAAAQDWRPDLLVEAGPIMGAPTDAQTADAARARAVLAALGPLDVGQGAVAARGQILGIETLQGTDAMLRFVAASANGSGGVLVKRPKPRQDPRADWPVIGPATVARVAEAGLSGIEIAAGGVMILDRAAVLAEAQALNITLWAAP